MISYLLISVLAWSETSLISLSDVNRMSLSEIKNEKSLVIAFQPDCSSCKKQIKDMTCLDKDYNVKLIGIASSEQALRKEYRKLRAAYPAFYAPPEAMRSLGISDSVTPQIVIWKNQKPLVYVGYKDCQEYKKLLSEAKNG